jgi:cyclomaltodextrinase
LIGMRRRNPWLHRARTRVLHLASEAFAFEAFEGDRRLMVALNLGKETALPTPGMGAILFGRDAALHAPKVELGESGWAVLSPATTP